MSDRQALGLAEIVSDGDSAATLNHSIDNLGTTVRSHQSRRYRRRMVFQSRWFSLATRRWRRRKTAT
jgi:hypothetical protein